MAVFNQNALIKMLKITAISQEIFLMPTGSHEENNTLFYDILNSFFSIFGPTCYLYTLFISPNMLFYNDKSQIYSYILVIYTLHFGADILNSDSPIMGYLCLNLSDWMSAS